MTVAAAGELDRARPPARELVVRPSIDRHTITFAYTADGWDHGAVRATYPFELEAADADLLPSMAAAVATYLGQLCLTGSITVAAPGSDAMAAALRPIAEMLHDIRRWMDDVPLADPPEMRFSESGEPTPAEHGPQPERAALMWSGGKDSTLAAVTLRANGYELDPIHATANERVAGAEQDAVRRLARRLDLPLRMIRVDHREFLEFSTRYAVNWNSFPYSNHVPFGRDLLIGALAAPVLRHARARYLSMGHDNECRNAYVDYLGKRIPRNDIESTEGALAFEAFYRRFMLPELGFLPPLANLSEFRILHEMLVHHPDLMAQTAFCFWGDNCGRCGKCLRYYLAQRVLAREVLSFAVNPLGHGACPELDDLLRASGPRSTLFQKEVVYCLGRLVERGDIRPDEPRLRDFATDLFPRIALASDEWEAELMTPRPDPQVPTDFDPLPACGVRLN